MVYITAVHMQGGTEHQHIASVKWRDPADNNTGQSTRETMVDWIKNKKGVAKVQGSGPVPDATVGVVDDNPPYLRTYADGRWTNNLLALPRY